MEWRLAVSLLGIKMINDTCFSNHVHLSPPVWLKFLLWSTWGSYHSRFLFLCHLKAFALGWEHLFLCMPSGLQFCMFLTGWGGLWWFCIPVSGPVLSSPVYTPASRALNVTQGLCRGSGWFGWNHSTGALRIWLLLCALPHIPLQTNSKGHRGMKGLALTQTLHRADSQGLSSPSGRSLGNSALRNVPADGRAGLSGELSIHALNSPWKFLLVPPWIKAKLTLLSVPHCGEALAFVSPNKTLNPLNSRGLLPLALMQQQDFSHSASMFTSDPGNVIHLLWSHQGSELFWVSAATASLLPGLLSAERMKHTWNSQGQI